MSTISLVIGAFAHCYQTNTRSCKKEIARGIAKSFDVRKWVFCTKAQFLDTLES